MDPFLRVDYVFGGACTLLLLLTTAGVGMFHRRLGRHEERTNGAMERIAMLQEGQKRGYERLERIEDKVDALLTRQTP